MTFFLTGGYTRDGGGEARGIGLAGDDGFLGTVADADSPSWIAVAGDRLYAVGESAGTVHTWRFDGAGLHPGDLVQAGGEIPCHLTVAPDALLVACYGDGVLTRVPLGDDGAPSGDGVVVLRGDGSGPHPDQAGPRIHASAVVPGIGVLATDLGSDAVQVLRDDGTTASWSVPAGTGPRDLALVGDRLLVVGELANTLVVLDLDGRVVAELRFPDADDDDHAAALATLPIDGGTRVFTGLRGSNRVSAIDLSHEGGLSPVASAPTGGEWPRHLVLDGDALRIANQLSSTITVLDALTLEPLEAPAAAPSPTQLLPVPDGWTALVR